MFSLIYFIFIGYKIFPLPEDDVLGSTLLINSSYGKLTNSLVCFSLIPIELVYVLLHPVKNINKNNKINNKIFFSIINLIIILL